MRRLSTMWQVALREVRERARSRAYRVTAILTLLIVVGLIVVPSIFQSDTEQMSVGSVGSGNDAIITTAEKLANANDEPGAPPSLTIDVTEYPTVDSASTALDNGDLDAVLVDGEELLVKSAGSGFSNSSTVNRLQQAASTVAIDKLVAEQGQAATDIIQLLTTDTLQVTTLSGQGPRDESQTFVAYAGLMLLYIAILLYGTWILTGVTEEKTNRVVEVLLSSVRPWQILGGKILGIGVLAMTQLLGTLLLAVVALRVTNAFDLPPIQAGSIINLLVWFVLGFAIFAVLFGASGSLVSRSEDAQTIAMPMTIAAVAGFFLSIVSLDNPEGPAAVIGTFIPVTAPFVVPVRSALDAIPIWQYLLAVVICLASLAGLTYIGGRIYAGGLLRFGSRVAYRDAWRSAAE